MKNYNKIREYRLKNNLSQEELGKLLEVKKSTISKYENGNIQIKEGKIKKMAEIFKVPPSSIMAWETIDNEIDLTDLKDEIKLIEEIQLHFGNESVELLKGFQSLDEKDKRLILNILSNAIKLKYTKLN